MPSWAIIAATVAMSVALVLPGLYLWLPARRDPDRRSELGIGLLTGAVVSFAVLFIQIMFDQHLQNAERHREQRARIADLNRKIADDRANLELTLGLARDLRQIDLHDKDLHSFYLRGKHLEDSVFDGAVLSGANLNDSFLEGASFDSAKLRDAQLIGADLSRARLPEAHLEHAALLGAHLEAAVLVDAHLEAAVLVDAHLERAYLCGADLSGADLEAVHLGGARYDARTRWPRDFDPARRPLPGRPQKFSRSACEAHP